MKRHIITTKDGSSSIYIPELNEHYHSIYGAVAESLHVFLKMGFNKVADRKKHISILEIGFGTGLNAMLTFIEAQSKDISIHYSSIEKYPLSKKEIGDLNYGSGVKSWDASIFNKMHNCEWENTTEIGDNFELKKIKTDLHDWNIDNQFDLIYFDAFAPNKQPDLWTKEVFIKMYNCLNKASVLTTYCAKGEVRRNMQAVGFLVERVPGPPGKREMLRATKE